LADFDIFLAPDLAAIPCSVDYPWAAAYMLVAFRKHSPPVVADLLGNAADGGKPDLMRRKIM